MTLSFRSGEQALSQTTRMEFFPSRQDLQKKKRKEKCALETEFYIRVLRNKVNKNVS